MLPESVDRVRIFTCDWPAALLVPSDLIKKTIEEYAVLLLEGIEDALFAGSARQQDRSIVFIASCLGGLILTRALVRADDKRNRYYRIRAATRGIVFLATPFRGTSFQDVAAWAERGLRAKASLQGREVSRLLDSAKGSTFALEQSIGKFTMLCQDKDKPCEVFSFYELGTTSLPHKAFPWLPGWFHQRKQLVHRSSATLDIIPDPLPLDRPHSLMNKFRDAQCPDYKKVAGQIRGMVGKIRAGTPLEQADRWIREEHYTEGKLEIIRLSRERLPMDQCYINLSIVEQYGQDASDSKKKGDTVPSPFSIIARQKVEAPDQTMQVELATIFDEREGSDGQPMHPRRILIRGRAGVGKTTLCKKIIYEFTKGTWGKWNELFDRVLWVPLRNLKLPGRRSMARYTFEDLFSHEFLLPTDGRNLAGALSCVLAANRNKTLFLLDGLDEVSQDLTGDSGMARFLDQLLNQPNVIITSRPSAKAPLNPHLELETIGFGPSQVKEYIEKSFTDPKTAKTDQTKVNKVQSFLQERWLIQGLVRIPIQLDALCYTWDDLKPNALLNTMTGIYKEIELKLWKNDVLRLEKKHDEKELTEEHLKSAGRQKMERFIKDEMAFVESLAFTGLHNDVVDFSSVHLDSISDHFSPGLLPDKTLPSLSFLRTSDPSSEYHNRNYHFIHLTFQEYFAAQYFVRQWNDQNGQLLFLALDSKDKQTKVLPPAEFLRKHKYTASYDIFWRFVAGLLDGNGQALKFINTVEEEPLDLLGPTHQRLVMHCLSEISSSLPMREMLEKRLAQWLLLESTFNKTALLASEVEFPELALKTSLLEESTDVQRAILRSLVNRASIPPSIIEQAAARLDHGDGQVRHAAVEALGRRSELPEAVLSAVAARLDDGDRHVRRAAVEALGGRSELPEAVLTAALGGRSELPEAVLTAVAARLDDGDRHVRRAAVQALGGRSELPEAVLTAVAARLDDGEGLVRRAAVEVLIHS
ncbi:Armadillo-type fold domain-containing protein [Cordyceps javanica]|uniref:Armadillo-type fold domain-containing protein n=1 Tax=Cordyceps javanica TaxID=43265 RepID=A0A545UL29_9HYPO|nr:Armadillo-type fold domain-containing protein [Cordyceps javanica]